MEKKIIKQYKLDVDDVPATVKIIDLPRLFVKKYEISVPHIPEATAAILDNIKEELITKIQIGTEAVLDPREAEKLKQIFKTEAEALVSKEIPHLNEKLVKFFAGSIVHEMFGLGQVEIPLADGNLEEIAINNSRENIWVYDRIYGWMSTNLIIPKESQINNYASIIGRKVGRQISMLNPLMDAHLITGDRVNATLFPISTKGNSITIRKFRRRPWTITDLLENKTLDKETTAFLWTCIEYEISLMISGGTASGKTTLLNALTPFFPTNQRIVSIEDTRELNLPSFLHWVPMSTRQPNPEGKGEISMLDLLVNSLRMRPDRIIVGEIRRQREAEVLFEAMNTGHSVYSTVHADTAVQTVRRLTTPPISLPVETLATLPVVAVMYRQRRMGIRRLFEVSEFIPMLGSRESAEIKLNHIYKWVPREDKIIKKEESIRANEALKLHVGMTGQEIRDQMNDKMNVLDWIEKHRVRTVDDVGKIISQFYKDEDYVLDLIKKGKTPAELGVDMDEES